MEGMEKRRPAQLSGGQQQRVALARALVLNPAVLLLDEPLGALDAKLRKTLQVELKALQEAVGVTFVYVTHDQEEALTMSDRLAVMAGGRIDQVGTPAEVYEQPSSASVADFLGVSNLLHAEATGADGQGRCMLRLGESELCAEAGEVGARGNVTVLVRPERVVLQPYGITGENHLPGMVERVVYLGSSIQLIVRLAAGGVVQALVQNAGGPLGWSQGTAVAVQLPPSAVRVLPDRDVPVQAPGADGAGDLETSPPAR
jgi:spermidine/putrescine transport system ATP-binding protein